MPPAQSSCSDVSLPWQTAAKASTEVASSNVSGPKANSGSQSETMRPPSPAQPHNPHTPSHPSGPPQNPRQSAKWRRRPDRMALAGAWLLAILRRVRAQAAAFLRCTRLPCAPKTVAGERNPSTMMSAPLWEFIIQAHATRQPRTLPQHRLLRWQREETSPWPRMVHGKKKLSPVLYPPVSQHSGPCEVTAHFFKTWRSDLNAHRITGFEPTATLVDLNVTCLEDVEATCSGGNAHAGKLRVPP